MSDQETWGGDLPEDPDAALAAEFVLRLLDPAEEAACAARVARDAEFAALVARWQADFAGFDAEFAPVAPPPAVLRRVEARLFGRRPSLLARVWNSAGLWRAVATVSVVAAAYFGTLEQRAVETGETPAHLVSAVAAIDSEVDLLAYFEPRAAVLNINRVSGDALPGRSLELWVILGEEPPISVGVLPEGAHARVPLPRALADRIGPGAVLAVSDEPAGGSPTGAPTGAVVAAGPISEV